MQAMTKKKIIFILKLLAAIIAAILATLGVTACTLSLSVAKNNNNATQKTEQKASSSLKQDSLTINF